MAKRGRRKTRRKNAEMKRAIRAAEGRINAKVQERVFELMGDPDFMERIDREADEAAASGKIAEYHAKAHEISRKEANEGKNQAV